MTDPSHCGHCPVSAGNRPCRAVATGHRRFCELTSPSNPDAGQRAAYSALLRGDPVPAPDPPPHPEPAREFSPPPLPPISSRLKSFASAVVSHVAAGLPTLDADAVAARLAVCSGCDQRTGGGLCAGCGCHLSAKARWSEQQCPLGKWPGSGPVKA